MGKTRRASTYPKITPQLLARCGRVADRSEHPGSGPLACWHRPDGLVNAIRSRLTDRRASRVARPAPLGTSGGQRVPEHDGLVPPGAGGEAINGTGGQLFAPG